MTDQDPGAVVDRALRLLLDHDMAGFAALWAPDGTMEFPFAAPGTIARLDGRDAVAAYLRDYTGIADVRAVVERTVHTTGDPETVVVEFAVEGIAAHSAAPYTMRYVAVVTVRGGEIVRYRDYWSPAAVAEAFGGTSLATAASR